MPLELYLAFVAASALLIPDAWSDGRLYRRDDFVAWPAPGPDCGRRIGNRIDDPAQRGCHRGWRRFSVLRERRFSGLNGLVYFILSILACAPGARRLKISKPIPRPRISPRAEHFSKDFWSI